MKYAIISIFILLTQSFSKKASPKFFEGWEQLIEKGVTISDRIKDPSGDSLDFIEDIQIYYESLEEVMEGMKRNQSKSLHDYVKLKGNGGPPHLRLYPVSPVQYLVDFYDWDEFTTWQFRGLMKYTWVLWLNMQDYAKEHFLIDS